MTETIFKAVKSSYNKKEHLPLLKKINPQYGLDVLIEQIESEKWTLYETIINDKIVGIFILRIENEIDGTKELVILHVVSALRQQIPFIVLIEPLIDDLAKQSNCKVIRVHSDNAAMNKLIEKHTILKVCETIYYKTVV